ncbi:envelope glycoprotein [Lonchura striata]|uniref:Envelope glycoprotein n=1 Tax=Lonchura striata TaxID=40157 RepID=A0A218UNV3_9PASE|nr:envelope glycoprotein [Lonchura striata domestica]
MQFKTKPSKALSRTEKQPQYEQAQFTDWGEIKIACAEWSPAAAVQAFPVRITGPEGNQQRVYAPVNPKDVQSIVKAIAEKGINSAMVSTLIDGLFSNDDLLPFDIEQIGRMILDGAGMIVFRQEWEDNCTKLLAQASGARQPLHRSTLSRLMGKHDDMITPQQQATQMRAEEVRATTRAAREAIRAASRVVAKPSPWSTLRQAESESFTQFVDRLQAAIDSSTLPAEAKDPVVADCLRQQCNSVTKDILRSLPAGASLADMIRHVVREEHLTPIQAAVHTLTSAMACFKCGIALDTPFSYSTASAPHQCRWDTPRRGITLSQITGQGKCFGNATLAKQKGNFCTKVVKPNRKTNKWVVPSTSGMWVCQRSGVSPCVFLAKFNDSIDFCVQVLIVPRVLYHSDEEVYHLFEEPDRLHKREIITGITIAMLLGLGAAGTATGVSAIATQQHRLSQLQMTIDEDLQRIEKSISYLEKSVSSLSEVVLQNRRGLDLLFMQQGGLCAALKEECCFYADHTGVIKDSMAELRDRLAQRKRDRETQQSWFESWFNQSPWLTTLISALVGPLAILLLTVTIKPCLLNKLVSFVQAHLEWANILFVGQQQML